MILCKCPVTLVNIYVERSFEAYYIGTYVVRTCTINIRSIMAFRVGF